MYGRDVSLLNFQYARRYLEVHLIHQKHKKILSLSDEEKQNLQYLKEMKIEDLSFDDKVYLQKLFILNVLYEHINKGDYIAEFILPFPLIRYVKNWVSAKGYCISPTPIDYSYFYVDVDVDGYYKRHQAEPLDHAVVCNYRILW